MKAQAIKLNDRVYWVGAIDWGMKEFHGYETQGSTYNAYLIIADKITLIDTVKTGFTDELLARISSVIEPSRIDYIVSNHTEMDHTGGLPKIIEAAKPEKLFASKEGAKAIPEHFNLSMPVTAVEDGETLSLGDKATLNFIHSRMIHWPDSMLTYLVEDGILFSQDAFGMHLASSERFDDQIDLCVLDYEAAKYYANIINPFSNLVAKLMEKLVGASLNLEMIAPDHGPVWRKHIDRAIMHYGRWSNPQPTLKVVIAYDTMWHSTSAPESKSSVTIALAWKVAKGMVFGFAPPANNPSEIANASFSVECHMVS